MQNLKQLIKEFRELREKATGVCLLQPFNEDGLLFLQYSANNITKLLDAVEVLVEELYTISCATPISLQGGRYIQIENALAAKEALQLAEEKVSGKTN